MNIAKSLNSLDFRKISLDKCLTGLFLILYIFGIFFHSFQVTLALMLKLTESFLYLGAILWAFSLYKNYQNLKKGNDVSSDSKTNKNYQKFIIWSISLFVFGMLAEIIGAATGIVFGEYGYGQTLGFQIKNVPIIIGLNWVFLVLAATIISEKFLNKILKNTLNPFLKSFLIALLASSLTVLYDFFMEPVAIKLDYWSWGGGDIPIQNYVAWFVISFIFTAFYKIFDLKIKSTFTENLFWIQLLFFIFLNRVL